jgi:LmbE family N-acetylglucosaminyl deacetylase
VLAPHPDDEALGCAGTLLQLGKKGGAVSIIFLTDGEMLHGNSSDGIGDIRREEARRSAGLLGCREAIFPGFPDGEIGGHLERVYKKLYEFIGDIKPDIVLSPSSIDYHPDHIATSHAAVRLMNDFRSFALVFYEVYSTLRFNYLVDISGVVGEKENIISTYRTSLYGKPGLYARAALGLNAHRSIFVQDEGFYEAFYCVEKDSDFRKIHDYLSYGDLNAAS